MTPEISEIVKLADALQAEMNDQPLTPMRLIDAGRLQEAINTLRRSSEQAGEGWQPIETAPRDGRRLLGTGGGLDDTVEVISYNGRVGAWDTENYTLDDRDDEAEGYNRPSHWQPMPSAHVSSPVEGK